MYTYVMCTCGTHTNYIHVHVHGKPHMYKKRKFEEYNVRLHCSRTSSTHSVSTGLPVTNVVTEPTKHSIPGLYAHRLITPAPGYLIHTHPPLTSDILAATELLSLSIEYMKFCRPCGGGRGEGTVQSKIFNFN